MLQELDFVGLQEERWLFYADRYISFVCITIYLTCLSPDNSNSTCVYTQPSFSLEHRHLAQK